MAPEPVVGTTLLSYPLTNILIPNTLTLTPNLKL